jgi:uncharacterized protein
LWTNHGVRILPGPSALWLDARGRRLPVPNFPGFDTLGALEEIGRSGLDHSWLVLTRKIADRELVLSGSDQNPDLTERSVRKLVRRFLPGAPDPVRALVRHCPDVVVATTLPALVDGMNVLSGQRLIALDELNRQIVARDREVDNPFTKDLQLVAVRGVRRYLGDRLVRVARPHRLLDPKAGPLIAIRLSVLTRKTLGGLQTDLSGRVLGADGEPVPGLYAAGEVAGFGGGGMHGHRSLEGTFLGGCLFTGREAGRALATATA